MKKLFLDLFQKTKIKCISGSTVSSFIQFVFIVYQVECYRNLLKLSYRPIIFTSYKTFFKWKGLELVFLPHFLHDFWRKMFLLLYLLTDQVSLPICLYGVRHCDYCTVIVCQQGFDTINFEINLIFLVKPYFNYLQNERSF